MRPRPQVCLNSAPWTNGRGEWMGKAVQDAIARHLDGVGRNFRYARRHPWIAGSLSVSAAGVGQLYNGPPAKGLVFYGSGWGVLLTALAMLLWLPAVPALMVLSWTLYVILEAVLTAHRQGRAYHLKAYNKWYVYLLLIAIVRLTTAAAAAIVRTFVVQAYKIPAGSMEDTLLIGDHILVSTFAYRWHGPSRGDLAVFPFPRDPSRHFIKRVIGLPGDRVEVRNHRAYVNGEPLNEPYVKLDERAALRPSRYSHWGPEVVPSGRLFVLGDSRDNSADSRDWGFVEREQVKGRACVIYWSRESAVPEAIWLDNNPLPYFKVILLDGIRWRRIGTRLD
jgi:signal peptidase I